MRSKRLSWMMRLMWAALPMRESMLLPLTLKLMSSRWTTVSVFFPFYKPRIFWTIYFSILDY